MTYVRPAISPTVSHNRSEGWSVALTGELYADAGESLSSLARSLCRSHREPVEFDVSGVTCIDHAGWDALRSAAAEVRDHGRPALITNPSPAVKQLTGLVTFDDRSKLDDWMLCSSGSW